MRGRRRRGYRAAALLAGAAGLLAVTGVTSGPAAAMPGNVLAGPARALTDPPFLTVTPNNQVRTLRVNTPGRQVGLLFAGAPGRLPSVQVVSSKLRRPATLELLRPDGSSVATYPMTGPAFRLLPALDAAGTWTLALHPQPTDFGQVQLQLTWLDAPVTSLVAGALTTTTITTPERVRVYSLAAQAPRTVTREVVRDSWTSKLGLAEMGITLVDPGAVPQLGLCACYGAWMEAVPMGIVTRIQVAGPWLVVFRGSAGTTGSAVYRLRLIADQLHPVTLGTQVVSTTVPTRGQNARYVFPATPGQRLAITVLTRNWGPANAGYIVATLLRPDGSVFAGWDEQTIPTRPAPDFFVFPAFDVGGRWSLVWDPGEATVGSQTAVLQQVAQDPAPRTIALGTPVAVDQSQPGLRSELRVAGQAGVRLQISVSGSAWTSRSLGGAPGSGFVGVSVYTLDGQYIGSGQLPPTGSGTVTLPAATAGGTWRVLVLPALDSLGSATLTFSLI